MLLANTFRSFLYLELWANLINPPPTLPHPTTSVNLKNKQCLVVELIKYNIVEKLISFCNIYCSKKFSVDFLEFFEKYVPKHLISLPPKGMILNVDVALNLSNYTLLKRFLCLKWILKNVFKILHFQFNSCTLTVTPFNKIVFEIFSFVCKP